MGSRSVQKLNPRQSVALIQLWDKEPRLRMEFANDFSAFVGHVSALLLGFRPRGHSQLPTEFRAIAELFPEVPIYGDD